MSKLERCFQDTKNMMAFHPTFVLVADINELYWSPLNGAKEVATLWKGKRIKSSRWAGSTSCQWVVRITSENALLSKSAERISTALRSQWIRIEPQRRNSHNDKRWKRNPLSMCSWIVMAFICMRSEMFCEGAFSRFVGECNYLPSQYTVGIWLAPSED